MEVSPSLAVATGELAAVKRALASATARRCLATAFDAAVGVHRTATVKGVRITTHIGRMVLTPLQPGAVVNGTDGGVGLSIGAGVEYTFVAGARILRIPTSLRLDILGFDVGRSGVSLLALSLGTPVPARLEAHLLSTLVSRARSASRSYPAISA